MVAAILNWLKNTVKIVSRVFKKTGSLAASFLEILGACLFS
jgi:hypothetical protein